MRKIPLALLAVAGAALLAVVGCTAFRYEAARKLAKASHPFSVVPDVATASMLVVGDSTGVGTGASSPEHSLAGRISASFPRLSIENRSEDGARAVDALRQLGEASSARYDVILVQVGGNDVIRFTRQDDLAASLDDIARVASARASLVIVMPAGNVGNVPFFLPPASWVMTMRARTLHALVRETAAKYRVTYVNLFKEKADDPFARDPARLNAADGLHPSDAGYAIWERELLAQSGLTALLRQRMPQARAPTRRRAASTGWNQGQTPL